MFSIKRFFSALVTAPGLAALPAMMLATLLAMTAVADPPSRVARINYLQGAVSLQRGDLEDWNQAVINYPLVANDSLWTDNQGRAELHIGSTAIRLADQTSISFLNLNDQVVQIRLAQGTVELNLNRLDNGETYEIATPDASVSLLRAGDYRLDVDEAGNATVITRQGQAEVTTGNAAFALNAGRQAYIINTDGSAYELSAARPPSDFEQWAEERTQREMRSASAQYVSREMTGYEDLDAYGSWTVLPDYGNVWTPYTVAAGWAPYTTGDWLWAEPYGWTWVDAAPWGFAPFHYGRWAFVGSRWYWAPGPLIARPVFAPALVSFVGGNNWGLSLGFGNAIGWFPLGPREFYRPAYFVSERYVRGLNPWVGPWVGPSVTNVYVTNRFVNRTVPGGVTVVSREAFTSGRNVMASRIGVEPRVLAEAPLAGVTAPVAPVHASLMARTNRAGFVARPPNGLRDRLVRTKTAPAPAAIPFAARQQALAANPGRPLDASALGRIRAAAPDRQVRGVMPVRPSSPQFAPHAAPPERTAPNISRPALPDSPGEFEHRAIPDQFGSPAMRAPQQHIRPLAPVRPNNPPAIRPEHVQPTRPSQQRMEHGNGFNPHHAH